MDSFIKWVKTNKTNIHKLFEASTYINIYI